MHVHAAPGGDGIVNKLVGRLKVVVDANVGVVWDRHMEVYDLRDVAHPRRHVDDVRDAHGLGQPSGRWIDK